ncbi:hypothetical protein [Nocardioides sp. AX2bis]|uniref:hypothetical protein n=1 Tax=Nocardioides sp. AX2bis TaxID=2653157 RepID=UPI0012F30CB5|nr:hypothetical protein [Nocardioides sp. AX2bis]VXC06894.1 conserved hypothetical protein [Nocardioides sp. AX2bis]
MTTPPTPGDISAVGLEGWFPLDLTRTPEQVHAAILAEYPAGDEVTAATAEGLVGMVRSLQAQTGEGEATGIVNLAAWVLLDDPATLSPVAVATLRGLVEESGDPMQVVAGMTAGAELYDEPPLVALGTASGPATLTRIRTVEVVRGGREVHEQSLVLWPRPQHGYVVTLSAYVQDLVLSDRVGAAMRQLATGITGL